MVEIAFLVGALASAGFLCIWIAFRPVPATKVIEDRMGLEHEVPRSVEELELQAPFSQRVLVPMVQRVIRMAARLAPRRNVERLRHDLMVAGNPYGLTVTDFLGIRFLTGVLGAAVGFVLLVLSSGSSKVVIFPIILGLLGFYLPNFWLKMRMSARQREIIRALPDALDMLTIAVDAGLGFDAAMLKIGERWDHALAREFNRVVTEIRLGKTRREALRDMADRLDVSDLSNFVAVLIQAEQLGLGIAKVLHTQSEQLRIRRRQRAEEEARKAPIKMLFPLIFLIFPAMFAVILGPAVPMFMELFAAMGG